MRARTSKREIAIGIIAVSIQIVILVSVLVFRHDTAARLEAQGIFLEDLLK